MKYRYVRYVDCYKENARIFLNTVKIKKTWISLLRPFKTERPDAVLCRQ